MADGRLVWSCLLHLEKRELISFQVSSNYLKEQVYYWFENDVQNKENSDPSQVSDETPLPTNKRNDSPPYDQSPSSLINNCTDLSSQFSSNEIHDHNAQHPASTNNSPFSFTPVSVTLPSSIVASLSSPSSLDYSTPTRGGHVRERRWSLSGDGSCNRPVGTESLNSLSINLMLSPIETVKVADGKMEEKEEDSVRNDDAVECTIGQDKLCVKEILQVKLEEQDYTDSNNEVDQSIEREKCTEEILQVEQIKQQDGSVIDGSVIDGSVIDVSVIDGSVIDGHDLDQSSRQEEHVEEVKQEERHNASVIAIEDDSDDEEELEQFFSNLRLESARKEEKAKRVISRKSLSLFIVSDSEVIEEEGDSEDEAENGFPSHLLKPISRITSPGCCTPPFRSKSHATAGSFTSLYATPIHNDARPVSLLYTPSSCLSVSRSKGRMVKELFEMFNETVFNNKFPADMPITWNKRMKTTAGWCTFEGDMLNRKCKIELSQKVCDTYERIRDTLIHELCHAATWVIDGKRNAKHGSPWLKWVHLAMSAHPDLPQITTKHSYEISYKYWYQCSRCDYKIGRHSKSINLNAAKCPYCSSSLELYS